MKFSFHNNIHVFRKLNLSLTLHKAIFQKGDPADIVLTLHYRNAKGQVKNIMICFSNYPVEKENGSAICILGTTAEPFTIKLDKATQVKIKAFSKTGTSFAFNLHVTTSQL